MVREFSSYRRRFGQAGPGVVYNCTRVLQDETALTMRDPFREDEERWITLGLDCLWPVARGRLHLARRVRASNLSAQLDPARETPV